MMTKKTAKRPDAQRKPCEPRQGGSVELPAAKPKKAEG